MAKNVYKIFNQGNFAHTLFKNIINTLFYLTVNIIFRLQDH